MVLHFVVYNTVATYALYLFVSPGTQFLEQKKMGNYHGDFIDSYQKISSIPHDPCLDFWSLRPFPRVVPATWLIKFLQT